MSTYSATIRDAGARLTILFEHGVRTGLVTVELEGEAKTRMLVVSRENLRDFIEALRLISASMEHAEAKQKHCRQPTNDP